MIARLAILMSAAALAAVVATPTLAASPRQAAMSATGVVIVGDRIIGADPDVNVRFELRRDAYFSEY